MTLDDCKSEVEKAVIEFARISKLVNNNRELMEKPVKNEDEIMKCMHIEKSYNAAGENLLTSFENYINLEKEVDNVRSFLYHSQYRKFKRGFKRL